MSRSQTLGFDSSHFGLGYAGLISTLAWENRNRIAKESFIDLDHSLNPSKSFLNFVNNQTNNCNNNPLIPVSDAPAPDVHADCLV